MANPFLVLGGIAVGIVTAGFGVLQVPGWVASAQDAAAINDLSNIRDAQAVRLSTSGAFSADFEVLSGATAIASDSQVADVSTLALARGGDGHFAPMSVPAPKGKAETVAFSLSFGSTLTHLGTNSDADAYCAVIQSGSGRYFAVSDQKILAKDAADAAKAMDGAACAADTRPANVPEEPEEPLPAGGNLVYKIRSDEAQCKTPELRFNRYSSSQVAAVINWGDGTKRSDAIMGTNTHTYATPGTYTVTVTGKIPAVVSLIAEKASCVIGVTRWDEEVGTKKANGMFYGNSALAEVADLPSTVVDTSFMFYHAQVPAGITSWKTSNVASMRSMFEGSTISTQDLSGWDVTRVSDMDHMFAGAPAFTGTGLEKWTTTTLRDIAHAFEGAERFNADIGGWNVSNVTKFGGAFHGAKSFNQPLDQWVTTAAKDMSQMFNNASSFNQNISHFDVRSLTGVDAAYVSDFFAGSKLTVAQLPAFVK